MARVETVLLRFIAIYEMFSLDSFKIDLKGLDEGDNELRLSVNDGFFDAVGATEVKKGDVSVALSIHRCGSTYTLDFHTEGTVLVPCDICLDDMDVEISSDNRLTAKLGDEYAEDGDLITVDEGDGLLDVSWFVYEFIALGIPVRHTHPEGKCNPEMLRLISEHTPGDGERAVDSRWSELEKIKTIIKD